MSDMTKRSGIARAGVSLVLVVGLSAACVPAAIAYSAEATEQAQEQAVAQTATAEYQKTEVVYATLSATGMAEGVYVVNQFDVSTAGRIVDFGLYDEVRNLTDQGELVQAGGSVAFGTDAGAFYYQGNVEPGEVKLPWDVHVSYTLDGKAIQPEELAGKSGALKVHLTTTPAAGADEAFLDSYMLQATFTLDGATTSDIVAEGATIASSGMDRTVAFTVLPGQNASCTLEAQVTDFEMAGASIVALPYSMAMELPDTDSMESQMQELSDAMAQLNSGTAELASGSEEFADGLNAYAQGAATIAQYSSMVNSGLAQIAVGMTVENMQQMAGALGAMADGLDSLALGLTAYQTRVNEFLGAYRSNELTEEEVDAFNDLPRDENVDADTREAIRKMAEVYSAAATLDGWLSKSSAVGVPTLSDVMSVACGSASTQGSLSYFAAQLRVIAASIYSSDQNAQTLATAAAGLQALSSQYTELNAGIAGLASGASALGEGYAQLNDGVSELADGMAQLNGATISLPATMRAEIEALMADYDFPEFEPASLVDERNDEHMKAVQFVMTTASIEVPQPEAEEAPEEEQTLLDRFFALFQ